MTVKKAILRSFNAGSYSATVEITGSRDDGGPEPGSALF